MREIKYYPPEKRRYVENNLQCYDCGNSNAFFIDLRLRHDVVVHPGGFLEVSLDPRIQKQIKNIEDHLWQIVARAHHSPKQFIHCANCEDGSLYIQEQILEWCWQTGCPGCSTCGNYISETEVRDFCSSCISQRDGQIEEEDCLVSCPYFEEGLGAVRDYHSISWEELKRELGYVSSPGSA